MEFSSCFPALPLNGSALCSLPVNVHSEAQVCCRLLQAGLEAKQKPDGGAGTGGRRCHLRWSPRQEGRPP